MKAKKWILLILVLLILGGGGWYIYKITHKPASEEEIPTTDLDKAKVGDVVVLGTYDKDNNAENGEEPLLWKVMAEEDGRLLLATYYGIECLQYNHYPMDITWEECTLRSWLNDENAPLADRLALWARRMLAGDIAVMLVRCFGTLALGAHLTNMNMTVDFSIADLVISLSALLLSRFVRAGICVRAENDLYI